MAARIGCASSHLQYNKPHATSKCVKQAPIKPQALRRGDLIGIAAPASPFDRAAFDRGIAVIESMGYEVKVPESCFSRKGYLAGSDTERVQLLKTLFDDQSVRAIFCARGGFGSLRLLPLIDFEFFATRPKILLGFSDITALLVAMYDVSNMVTFHGPVVTTLKQSASETRTGLTRALESSEPWTLQASKPVVIHPGRASGPLIGGNLTTLCHLLGTPYAPSFDDHLLFLEDRGEAPYRIDRMFSQLNLGGHLDGIVGVVLGSFENCGPPEEIFAVVKEAFRHRDVPILAGFGIGHGAENLTVPIGIKAEIDTEQGSLRFLEPAVRDVEA